MGWVRIPPVQTLNHLYCIVIILPLSASTFPVSLSYPVNHKIYLRKRKSEHDLDCRSHVIWYARLLIIHWVGFTFILTVRWVFISSVGAGFIDAVPAASPVLLLFLFFHFNVVFYSQYFSRLFVGTEKWFWVQTTFFLCTVPKYNILLYTVEK